MEGNEMNAETPKGPKAFDTFDAIKRLWSELEDVPVALDEDGDTVIDSDFGLWKRGTSRERIWQWFDERCPHGVAVDLM
jgi:hypothetical protein